MEKEDGWKLFVHPICGYPPSALKLSLRKWEPLLEMRWKALREKFWRWLTALSWEQAGGIHRFGKSEEVPVLTKAG